MSEAPVHIYDSSARQSPALEELREIIRYRELVYQFIRRDVLTRYKRSVLGIAWTMLNPLGTMLVLTVAFSRAFNQGKNFPVYLLSGFIAWNFFSQTTNAAMVHLIWGEGLLKRIYLPRTVFAIAAAGTGLVNVGFSLVPLIIVMLVTGVPIRPSILFLPVPLLFLTFFSIGIGLLLSGMAVYFADVAEMYQVAIMAWMYLTPIIYPVTALSDKSRFWISHLNPLYHLVILFRAPIFDGIVPDLNSILISGLIGVVTLLVGWIFFTMKADEFAYRI